MQSPYLCNDPLTCNNLLKGHYCMEIIIQKHIVINLTLTCGQGLIFLPAILEGYVSKSDFINMFILKATKPQHKTCPPM